MRRILRDYQLSIVLAFIFIATILLSFYGGWAEFVAEQSSHQQPAEILGDDGYIWTFLEQTLQNWQSEFLAVFSVIVLSSRLIHRDSAMSKDSRDEMRERVEKVGRRVDGLVAKRERA